MATQTVCHACYVRARTAFVSRSGCLKANEEEPTTMRVSMRKHAPMYQRQTSRCRLVKLMLCCSNVCNDGHRNLARTVASTSRKLIVEKLTVKSQVLRTPLEE